MCVYKFCAPLLRWGEGVARGNKVAYGLQFGSSYTPTHMSTQRGQSLQSHAVTQVQTVVYNPLKNFNQLAYTHHQGLLEVFYLNSVFPSVISCVAMACNVLVFCFMYMQALFVLTTWNG